MLFPYKVYMTVVIILAMYFRLLFSLLSLVSKPILNGRENYPPAETTSTATKAAYTVISHCQFLPVQ